MKTKVFFIMMFCTSLVYAQIPIDIQKQLNSKRNFVLWAKMHNNFRLSDFEKWEEKEIKKDHESNLDSINHPDYIDNLFIYSPDIKKRVDIYREYGIIKIKDKYYTDPSDMNAAFIQDLVNRRDILVHAAHWSGMEEAVWLNNDEVILLGGGMEIYKTDSDDSCSNCTMIMHVNLRTMKSILYTSSKPKVSNRKPKYESYIKLEKLGELKEVSTLDRENIEEDK